MLSKKLFSLVVDNTPLVSIDICLTYDFQILLGKRENEPLKGKWFTPGGRIFKNEAWTECIKRVSKNELGIDIESLNAPILMGIWDHFYSNSYLDDSISTHYINLPHHIHLDRKPDLIFDKQHREMNWFDLNEVASSSKFHEYMNSYASWIAKKRGN